MSTDPLNQILTLLAANTQSPNNSLSGGGNSKYNHPFLDDTTFSRYVNNISNAGVRKMGVNPSLETDIRRAVASVYGPDYEVVAFSGAQPARGSGGRRTGSTRHDLVAGKDYGDAVDVHIIAPSGERLTGEDLAPLAHYWSSNNIGSMGIPARGSNSGIHMDYIGGKGRALGTGEGRIWGYGGDVPDVVRTAFNDGLKGRGRDFTPMATEQSPILTAFAQQPETGNAGTNAINRIMGAPTAASMSSMGQAAPAAPDPNAWRKTESGGERFFDPSSRQYIDRGGSRAGLRSLEQTTGPRDNTLLTANKPANPLARLLGAFV